MPRTRLHECAGRCGERIGRTRRFCHTCWLRLPVHLRRAFTGAHPQSTAHRVALDNAHTWLTDQHPVRTGGTY